MTGRKGGRRGCLGCASVLALLSAGGAAVAWSMLRQRSLRPRDGKPAATPPDHARPIPAKPAGAVPEVSSGEQDMGDRRRETTTYLVGYALALALTLAAFGFVVWPVAAFGGTFAIILGLALVQGIVQFRCFLHISLARSARADLLLVLFAALIVTLMVSGTLVILFNLRMRMM